MENLLAFSHSLELSSDTRIIIRDMLRSMQSLFPHHPELTTTEKIRDNDAVILHAREILDLVNNKPEIFDGILNPEDLQRYIRTTSELGEISDQVKKLSDSIKEYQDLTSFLCYKLLLMITEHLGMTCPGEYESIFKQLSDLDRPAPGGFINDKYKLRVV